MSADSARVGPARFAIALGVVFAVVVAGVVPACVRLREAHLTRDRLGYMHNVLQAMRMHSGLARDLEVKHSGETNRLSWRLDVLTLLEQPPTADLGADANLAAKCAWNDPRSPFANFSVRQYCWSGSVYSNVLAVRGQGTAYDSVDPASIPRDAICLIGVPQSDIHWMEPRDFDPTQYEAFLSSCTDDFYVAFWDGEVWKLRAATPAHVLEPFLFVETATNKSRDDELATYRR